MDTQQPNQESNVTDGAAAEQPPVAPPEKKTSRRQLMINVVIGVGGLARARGGDLHLGLAEG